MGSISMRFARRKAGLELLTIPLIQNKKHNDGLYSAYMV
jgi:hypothetical protein